MKLKLLCGLWFVGTLTSLWAAPLRDVPVTLLQPDGDTLCCFATGDEYFNYLHDEAGYVIMRDEVSGYYAYAKLSGDKLVATAYIPGRDNPKAAKLKLRALPSAKKIAEQAAMQRQAMATHLLHDVSLQRAKKNTAANPLRNHGVMNNIVMYIRFADDDEFTPQHRALLDNFCNDDTDLSLRTYYREASYGIFEPLASSYPVVSGATYSYQDTNPRAYYMKGEEDGYTTEEEREERELTLLKNAVEALKNQIPANLNIDMNNDDYVDNIIFIVKGNVQSASAWGSLLWPHTWSFSTSYSAEINGKTIGDFIFLLEENLLYSGVSTLCHEFFHVLGAPDLYHYDKGKDLNPVGQWDLMEYNTSPPQQMGAYMKYKYGNWIDDIPVVSSNGTYTLSPLNSATSDKVCYKLTSPIATGSDAEYYVVEYRKKTAVGIESQIPGSGLLIYRINPKFAGNDKYNGTDIFDEVYIYRPNGTSKNNGLPDLAAFSADSGRVVFDATTNPYCFLTDDKRDALQLFNISAIEDSISFCIDGIPTAISITNEVIYVGKMDTLRVAFSPPAATASLLWSVQNVSGEAFLRDDKIIGQKVGYINVHVELYNFPEIYADKRIIISDDAEENPLLSYWASRGVDGLLTIEAPDGISKIEVFTGRGSKIGEQNIGGTTTYIYSFATYPHGLYFLRIWNAEGTKFSTIKTLW